MAAETVDISISDDENDNLQHVQRLKAAMHYTIGQICDEVGSKKGLTFSKPMIAALSELTFAQCGTFAADLEDFSKHAKRTTITEDDVKLLVRRNDKLGDYIAKCSDEYKQEHNTEKAKKKLKRVKLDQAGTSTSNLAIIIKESDDDTGGY